jgi:hypothetical protein
MVDSPAWKQTIATQEWTNMYQPADEFAAFLKNSRGSVFPPVAIETAGVMIGAGEERPTTFWWSKSP